MRNDVLLCDDLFIYAPSALMAEEAAANGVLLEGKALGTARERDLVLLDKDLTVRANLRPTWFRNRRDAGRMMGRRKLKEVQDFVEVAILNITNDYLQRRIDPDAFRTAVVSVMQEAWHDVYVAGIRAAGHLGDSEGPRKIKLRDPLSAEDKTWLRSAIQHEMRFLNGFINDVVDRTWRMPLPKRIAMYARTLESFYDSARVIGIPATTLIYWTGPWDNRKCPGCEYLMEHSPYTKASLPTTPKSGITACLTNCRDRLLLRHAGPLDAEVMRIVQSHTRGEHIKNLRRIRLLGHL